MENPSIYLDVLLRLMKLALVDKIDLQTPAGADALSALTDQTRTVAELAESDEDGMVVSGKLPTGYLSTSCGEWTVAVPWSLVDTCPTNDLLSEFCTFATEAKVGQSSIICISGTSARAGGITQIGDVDLSEYVFDSDRQIPGRYVRLFSMSRQFTLDVQAMIFALEFEKRVNIKCPWPANEEYYGSEHHLFLDQVRSMQTKLDLIGISSVFGYIPVTNMIFPCPNKIPGYHTKSGVALSSFSFQEAVLVSNDHAGSLWPLVDVHEYVYYIQFLVKDTLKYLDVRPIKALKRASALARMLQIARFDQEFYDLLGSDYANRDAIDSRVNEVRKLVSMRGDGDAECFQQKTVYAALDKAIDDAKLNDDEMEFDRLRCRTAVEQLLALLRSYVSAVDARLEADLFGAQMASSS